MKDAEYGLLNVMLLFHVLLRMSSSLKMQNSLVANGCIAVCEGANMPTTLDATKYLTGKRRDVCSW